MKIASLLPSSTEILFALGLGEHVVGVSHECDHPADAVGLPVLTRSSIDAGADSRTIDRQVRERTTAGLSLYQVDEARLSALAPDIVVTQDTCQVCAVSLAEVERAVCAITGGDTTIVSLSPSTWAEVLASVQAVARACGVAERGVALTAELGARLEALRAQVAGRPRPRTLVLEWLDPPMPGGHWTPELIDAAGGEPVLGHRGTPTRPVTWQAIADAAPEVILAIPCGFPAVQTERELPALLRRPELAATPAAHAGRVAVIDGNAYFNRPGPRLVDSAQHAAAVIHPDAVR